MVDNFFAEAQLLIDSYDHKDIHNCNETSLFFKNSHKRSLVFTTDDKKCGKLSKERNTLLLCRSEIGERTSFLVIEKYANPRCLKNIRIDNLNISHGNNKKALMTKELFEEWLVVYNIGM